MQRVPLGKSRAVRAICLCCGVAFAFSLRVQALTIIPTFDSSITIDPNATTIMTTIKSAIAVYESDFSDPVIVRVEFHKKTGPGHANNCAGKTAYSYGMYRTALLFHSTTIDDVDARQYMPDTPNNPVNNTPN